MRDMRAYIDSNVFILAAVSTGKDGENARQLLTLIAQGRAEGITSALAFDEVFYQVKGEKGNEAAISLLENLLAMPNLSWMSADTMVLNSSLSLLKDHKIQPRDAIHLATSIMAEAGIFVTEDKSLAKATEVNGATINEAISKIENRQV